MRLLLIHGCRLPREPEARIARLHERLERGDPDLPPDELQAAIERAEGKRRELVDTLPEAKVSYKLLAKRVSRRETLPPVDHRGVRWRSMRGR
jgi:hypothetical protein